jgi:hypothetical protein
MLRTLAFVFLVLALAAADQRAQASSYALTRLTDNTWDDMAGLVDRLLVLDVAMRPNAVFVGSTPGGNQAIYLAWRPDSWIVQPIVEDPFGVRWPSVAGAPGGAVHVAFCQWTEPGTVLCHTRVVDGVADPPESVCPADPSSDYPSIAVGLDGTVHLVFCQSSSICYARRDAGVWSPPEILAEGRFASLAVGPNGECHVVYVWVDEQWTSTVQYVHGGSGSWSPPEQLAGSEGLHARYPTIAVDAEGRVHTAYEQVLPDDQVLHYRVRSAGVWSAAEFAGWGVQPAVAVDASGGPHLAFWAIWTGAGIAVSHRLAGADWITVPVDPDARFGFEMPLRPGLAVDDANDVHVVYDSRDPRGGDDTEIWYAMAPVTTDVPRVASTGDGELSSWPNPARRSLMLGWALVSPGWARVEVFDVRGRHVRTLREGPFSAGNHVLTWDGLDTQGRPVSAGVYWCRASTRSTEAARKVVLIGE